MIPLALVYAVHLGLVFVGFKSLPMEQMAVMRIRVFMMFPLF